MYQVNNIFYSLQGEGYNTGRAALFVRFAGCNLRCPFCDTDFSDYQEMTGDAIVQAIDTLAPKGEAKPMVVLTGGEPTLQADNALIDLLHDAGYWVAMESNGTRPVPSHLDWLTLSPKWTEQGWCRLSTDRLPDELKLVFDEQTPSRLASFPLYLPHTPLPPSEYPAVPSPSSAAVPWPSPPAVPSPSSAAVPSARPSECPAVLPPGKVPLLFLQPCDTGSPERNRLILSRCIDYIKQHPQWRLSLQTHKLIGIE